MDLHKNTILGAPYLAAHSKKYNAVYFVWTVYLGFEVGDLSVFSGTNYTCIPGMS